MAKSGLKLIAVSLVLLAIGLPLAKATDSMTGRMASACVATSIIISFIGIALLIYGIYKLIAGALKRG